MLLYSFTSHRAKQYIILFPSAALYILSKIALRRENTFESNETLLTSTSSLLMHIRLHECGHNEWHGGSAPTLLVVGKPPECVLLSGFEACDGELRKGPAGHIKDRHLVTFTIDGCGHQQTETLPQPAIKATSARY